MQYHVLYNLYTYIYINELIKHKLYDKIWQAYAGLLPMRTVGVMGDSRTYDYTCLLRAVTSEDGMTADYFNFPKEFLDKNINWQNFSFDKSLVIEETVWCLKKQIASLNLYHDI